MHQTVPSYIRNTIFHFVCISSFILIMFTTTTASADELNLLFMGDNGHHQPTRRFQELAPSLLKRGISLRYTDQMDDINPQTLAKFDGLVLYANIDHINDAQASALLNFVSEGHGFIPLHCASYCWRNNKEIVALIGAQFQRHGGQVFSTQIASPNHPIMQGYNSFTSWDETYIHHMHNEKNRTVLEYRVEGNQATDKKQEPWTWIRSHGKGRVFYTAWGHDQRTFMNPGFHNLVERGIRWACGDDPGKVPSYSDPTSFDVPQMTELRKDVKKFEYTDVGPKIPNYTPGKNWGTQSKPRNSMQKPLTVKESIKHFVTPQGMAVRRYADERNFHSKPIAMTWDERGRLWVCETVDYPNQLGQDRDRIRICEDTNGDHVADKFTIFAEGLSIPTAIVIVRGGAIVQNGTETIYLKDRNGDDVSDQKATLISNWTLGDTHGGVSNFRYGLDNWIWAMQGYNKSTPKINGQATQSFGQGFWRFKLSQTDPPKVTDLEFIRSSNNNTWGLGISEEGLIFGSTANRNPSMFMPVPNRYYERVRGWAPSTLNSIADSHLFKPITDKIRQVDHHGGYTAAAGHALYTARTFPQQWWNKTAFVCGPTGHLVGTYVLRRNGANYESTSPINLLASNDEWNAPVMAEVGPDGAVWVIDWYNYIVQHNPTPHGFKTGKGRAYESDLRDKKHGRIYRVVPVTNSGDKLHNIDSLSDKSNLELVQVLKHPSFVWRLQAQRLLIERKAEDVLPLLVSLVADQSIDEIGLNIGAIHALHTLKGLGYVELNEQFKTSSLAVRCLKNGLSHPSPGVRRNAVAILPTDELGLKILLAHQRLFDDSDVQVRLQAILTLADMPASDQAGVLVAELTLKETDVILLEGLTSAAATHAVPFLQSVTSRKTNIFTDANKKIVGTIAEHIARGRPNVQTMQSIIAGMQDTNPEVTSTILIGLTNGLPANFMTTKSASMDAALVTTFKKVDAGAKVKLIQLASQCNTTALDKYAEEMIASLVDIISDNNANSDMRAVAARDLVSFRVSDEKVVGKIVDQINAQTPPNLADKLFEAIGLSESQSAGEMIIKTFSTLTPKLKSTAINTMLSKPAWTQSLLKATEARKFDLNDLSLGQKQSLRSFPDERLRIQAEKLLAIGGGLPDANREKVLNSLLHITKVTGEAKAGKAVFKKVCAACHQHGEMGHPIGPNLTGMAVHPKVELLTHIIDPSRNVEGNYRLYNVLKMNGQVINGMLAGESRTSITIVDSQGKKTNIPREDIDELIASRKSVMPEGFEKQISRKQLTDLLEFLTSKGRFLPIPLERYATAVSTRSLFHTNENGPDRMIFPDWKPKTFKDIPFVLTDPHGKTTPNIVLLNGPYGPIPPKMPKSVSLPCNTSAKTIHLLSGVGGWSFPASREKTISMIVRLHYVDGLTEDHNLLNRIHFADYIRRVDVPKSEFAFQLRGQQIRYLVVKPKRQSKITNIEFIKGTDNSAPIVMAVTVER